MGMADVRVSRPHMRTGTGIRYRWSVSVSGPVSTWDRDRGSRIAFQPSEDILAWRPCAPRSRGDSPVPAACLQRISVWEHR